MAKYNMKGWVSMKKTWEIDYKGHKIVVENTWFNGERLYVDGELQDEEVGFGVRARLFGRIKSGDGAGEIIKVSIGAWFNVDCRIFVNEKLLSHNG
jgi:hypothetical protein